MKDNHTFHIPVMGIGYTLDTPLKVSQYGIDSVVSLVDDILLEKMRKMYSEKFEIPFQEITDKIEDFRAKRITSYLNLMNQLAERKFDELKNAAMEKRNGIKEYLSLLPDKSALKQEFYALVERHFNLSEIKSWIDENLSRGSIDVNIMTKVDKDNYRNGEQLPVEFNDAHAALRGYGNSDLHSSIVLSAGMNPGLYSYIEQFEDFYPDYQGNIKKKIVLKVSDFRSALIQGKFFAKKGLWVSEYRIESGLNCGGHAFATNGNLMGPILAEFKENRDLLISSVHEILVRALTQKNRIIPERQLPLKITAQGGVGTAEEHRFLMEEYGVDSVGWGSPFLLVPEATSVDEATISRLMDAREEDLYLSNISPLGVPFNNLRGNTKDFEKESLIEIGKPGSTCPKRYVCLNDEFTKKGLCTASRSYQYLKLKELNTLDNISSAEYQERHDKIVEKSCICVGLGTSALLAHSLDTTVEGAGVSVCPGPGMAYFSKKMSLHEMVDHIYGRVNVITRTDRPHMFVKELMLYIDFLKNKIEQAKESFSGKQEKSLRGFAYNLKDGIEYYQSLFESLKNKFVETKSSILSDLNDCKKALTVLDSELEKMSSSQPNTHRIEV